MIITKLVDNDEEIIFTGKIHSVAVFKCRYGFSYGNFHMEIPMGIPTGKLSFPFPSHTNATLALATIQNVAPSYYALQNVWEIETDDDPITSVLKRIMTEEIIQKVWTSLNSIHFIATYLDPTQESFLFVKNKRDCVNLFQSAREVLCCVVVQYAYDV